MKEKLFLRATQSQNKKRGFNRIFFNLIMLPLLCIAPFFSANALEADVPQQDQQGVIYVSENAIVVGFEQFSNASIVKIKTPIGEKKSKRPADKKINRAIPIAKKESVTLPRNLPKVFKPKFVFRSVTSEHHFVLGSSCNSRNSIINPVFFAKNILAFQDILINNYVFLYLKKIYSTGFSKTATLSHFLLSRPPPFC